MYPRGHRFWEEDFILHAECENVRLHQTDSTAGIQDGLERLSVNLHVRFWSSKQQVAVHNAACQPGPCGKCGSLCRHGFIPRRGSRRPAQWSLGALWPPLLLNHPPGKRRCSLPSLPMLGSICQLYGLHELQGGGWVAHSNRLSVRTGKGS